MPRKRSPSLAKSRLTRRPRRAAAGGEGKKEKKNRKEGRKIQNSEVAGVYKVAARWAASKRGTKWHRGGLQVV